MKGEYLKVFGVILILLFAGCALILSYPRLVKADDPPPPLPPPTSSSTSTTTVSSTTLTTEAPIREEYCEMGHSVDITIHVGDIIIIIGSGRGAPYRCDERPCVQLIENTPGACKYKAIATGDCSTIMVDDQNYACGINFHVI